MLISKDWAWSNHVKIMVKGMPDGEIRKGKDSGGKIGPKNTSQPNLHWVCPYVCHVITPGGCDAWCQLQARVGGPHLGNLPKISTCVVGSKLHRNHSRVQPNSFSKRAGSLECYLDCALLRYACPVCSALALSPLVPIWTNLPGSKLPTFNQMAPITLPTLFSV